MSFINENNQKIVQSVIEDYAESLIHCSVSGGNMCNFFVGLLSDHQPNSNVEVSPKWKSLSSSANEAYSMMCKNDIELDMIQSNDWASLMSSDSETERDKLICQSSSILADFLQGVCDDIHNSAEKCKDWLLKELKALQIDTLDLLYQREFSLSNRISVLSGILSFIHATFEFHRSVAESLTPLSIYPSVKELYNDHGRLSSYLRQSAIIWIALSKENRIVCDGYGISTSDLRLLGLPYFYGVKIDENIKKKLSKSVDSLLQKYVKSLISAPIKFAKIPSCFSFCPSVLEKILQLRCNSNEYLTIDNDLHIWSRSKSELLLYNELSSIPVLIGDNRFTASLITEQSVIKQKINLVSQILKEALGQRSANFSNDTVESASIQLLKLLCPSISGHASRIATLILFGKSNLVSIRKSPLISDQLVCEISLIGDSIHLEVPYIWWITEDFNLLSIPLDRNLSSHPLAIVHTNFRLSVQINDIFTFSLSFLPKIDVKLCEKSCNDDSKLSVFTKISDILPFFKLSEKFT